MQKLSRHFYVPVVRTGLAVLLAGSLLACTPRVDVRGNVPDPERLAEIVPGEIAKEEVAEILGSPSSVATFGQETWYYVSQRTETLAFFEPEIKERKVVILRFDKEGLVSEVRTLTADDGQTVNPIERRTPTAGNELDFIDQLLGNIGRFR